MSIKLSLLALVALLAAAIFQQRSHRPTPPVGHGPAGSAHWEASDDEAATAAPPG